MTDSTISAMPPASLPLSDEAVPCVQDGDNVQAPAAAFGIPIASMAAPEPLADYQTWIDQSTTPPTLRMYVGGAWKPIYQIGSDGKLTFTLPLTLAGDPTSNNHAATKHYVDQSTGVPGAMIFKGVINCAANPNFPAANDGDFYVVGTAGKIGGASGIGVETSDTLLCRVHGTSAGNYASVGGNWTIGQGNVARPVTGPASATNGNFAAFSGTTGMVIADSGLSFDQDATMAANDDSRIPSQKAVKSGIGGKPLSTDTLSQGQGWFWDGVSSTFKARSNEGQNLLANSAFDIWQENTSYTLSGSATKVHIADCWKATSNSANRSVFRTAGISNSQYALKILRASGASASAKVVVAQQFSTVESLYLAGKTVTVSFDYLIGANYTPVVGPQIVLLYGTGTEEDIDLHATTPAFTTGGGNVTFSLISQVGAIGVVARLISPPIAIPSTATEVALAIYVGGFVGTAGADDSATIANVKMEFGNIATHYRKPSVADEMPRCLRRYQKSFAQATVPAQNAGALTGEKRWRRFGSTAVGEGLHVQLSMPMRIAPAITFFNPSVANAQVRNETASLDCSATTAQNVSDAGFEIACTGNAGGAAGDWLGVHWVADARL